MNGVQTRFKCKLDVKRCKRFVFPPSSLLPRSNALKTKAIRYFQTDRTLTRIVSPPLQITVVNESGLYHLIFLSRKPEAKAFRKWVTNEVLPSIRRTGGYSVRPAQRPTLPAPKYRPDFIDWKQAVCRYLNRNDLKTVAVNMKVTYSHVCKVYSGNTMSRRIADRLTKLAISHKNKGIIYPEPVPVYRQLLIEWEEQG